MSAGVLSALICALWVAVCAAAPEFIWQGLKATLHHLSREDVIAALLIGLMLACFVEPATERVRDVVLGAGGAPAHTARPRSPLFTAGLSLTFALASVSLHHAMTAFLSNHGGASGGEGGALVAGIRLAVAWAIVPFAITLAWLGAGRTLLAVPLGIIGIASPGIAGWLFGWPALSVIATTLPCVCIQVLGYRRVPAPPTRTMFPRRARVVAVVASVWLAAAWLFDAAASHGWFAGVRLYDAQHFWMDARFYLGWTLGLVLAPSPADTDHPL
jgi:hypothetical protein